MLPPSGVSKPPPVAGPLLSKPPPETPSELPPKPPKPPLFWPPSPRRGRRFREEPSAIFSETQISATQL